MSSQSKKSSSPSLADGLGACLGKKPGDPYTAAEIEQLANSGDDTSCSRMAKTVLGALKGEK